MRRSLLTLAFLLIAMSLLGIAAFGAYRRDMSDLRLRLTKGSSLIDTRHGLVEVAVRGAGTPVLLLHGAGGGYDQALLLAQMFGPPGHQWIAVKPQNAVERALKFIPAAFNCSAASA